MSKQLCSVFSKRLILEHTRNQALWDWILEFEMPLHWKPAIVHSVSLARFRVRLNLAIRYYIATVCLLQQQLKYSLFEEELKIQIKQNLGTVWHIEFSFTIFLNWEFLRLKPQFEKKIKWPYLSSWYRVSQCKLVYFILLQQVEICKLALVWRWSGNSE